MAKKNENILHYVHIAQERCGIHYATPDSRISKILRRVYFFVTLFVVLINIIFIIGTSLVVKNAEQSSALTQLYNGMITVATFTVFPIICCILQKSKKLIPAVISIALNTICCIILLLFFYSELKDGQDLLGLTAIFVFRHAIPLIILLVTGNWVEILTARFNINENRAYSKMVDNLYRIYSAEYTELSDVQWEEYLQNYAPVRPQKLKRSRKTKIKKQENKEIV